ncbi:putative 8-amino-7-oxononanoate synthase [Deinococcus roseus]|uniref:8-amino-7-oxononanoate synthase n=1 Tax=Deinococcus roseus TaxID=392414 RepID=A0ABQ2CYE7_9DEIO|nr:putative 8-amino-7-oxononanoate synthase [Deinococcus roseus]
MQSLLEEQKQQGLLRSLTSSEPAERPGWIRRGGQLQLDLASNDYLGLSRHQPTTADPLIQAALNCHASTASRLVVGNHPIYPRFETALAELKGTEAALTFCSGYAANTGTLAALVSRHDTVFSDRLNHASIIDGIRLSGAKVQRYAHFDLGALEKALQNSPTTGRRWIVTDAVFSMDGTQAHLTELVRLKHQYGAYLMLDEAHSAGVFGPQGAGLAHAHHLQSHIDILMGTLGKAYGSHGAYIAGDRVLIQHLMQQARSWVFTTALPPSVVARSLLNLQQAMQMDQERETLQLNAKKFREQLQAAGLNCGASSTQIIPLLVGSNENALRLGTALQGAGLAAIPIRPPTVPAGTARIRFSLTAAHRWEDLQHALDTIISTCQKLELGQ